MSATEAQKRATAKYKREKLKRIPFEVSKEKYDEIKSFTDSKGETVNGFIKRAIDETMQREKDLS